MKILKVLVIAIASLVVLWLVFMAAVMYFFDRQTDVRKVSNDPKSGYSVAYHFLSPTDPEVLHVKAGGFQDHFFYVAFQTDQDVIPKFKKQLVGEVDMAQIIDSYSGIKSIFGTSKEVSNKVSFDKHDEFKVVSQYSEPKENNNGQISYLLVHHLPTNIYFYMWEE